MIVRQSVVAALTFASVVAQQRTLIVDQTAGPYYEINYAVAAAQPGDRIEVHPGRYYNTFTVSIGLDIFAPFGGVELVGNLNLLPTIAIVNLPSNQALRLDRITLSPNSFWTTYPPILSIQRCAGSVHVHQLYTNSSDSAYIVDASPRVAMTRCTLPGLTLTGSSVVFDACGIQGARGVAMSSSHPPGNGQSGLVLVQGSHAFLTNCVVAGGDGAQGGPYYQTGGYGAVGAVGDATSSLQAVGGSRFTGGLDALYQGYGTRQAGLWFFSASARLGPGVTATSLTPVVLIAEPPHVSAPLLLPPSTTVAIQVTNTANQAVLLGIDTWNDLIQLPGVELPFVLTIGATLYAFAPPLAASTTQFSLYVPPVPWLTNQFVHLQAVTLNNNSALQFSSGGYSRIQ